MINEVYIIIGGNLGNVKNTFSLATTELENIVGRICKQSSIYQTAAWGDTAQPNYLNQVLQLETKLTPEQLLKQCLEIEKRLGRVRDPKNQWAGRTIDIDILYYNTIIIEDINLVIPHPRMHLRNFVLIPLAEIAPTKIHPLLNKTSLQMAAESIDKSEVNAL